MHRGNLEFSNSQKYESSLFFDWRKLSIKKCPLFLSKKSDGEAYTPGKGCSFTKINDLLRKQSHSCPLTLATHLIVGH